MSRLAAVALACAMLACASGARGEPVEPPASVPEGEDAAYEANDSLASGEVELGLGMEGASGRAVHRRRVRFDEPDFAGALREGRGDPLSGGEVEGRSERQRFVAGKLSPRWGRGLLLGSPAEPWQRATVSSEGALRGRAGEGVLLSRGEESGLELLAGRFARRDLAGARAARGPVSLGVLGGRGGALQSSLAVKRGRGEVEAALDRRGGWSADGLLERPVARWSAGIGVRAGAAGFRSLAEPSRRGPSRGLTVAASGPTAAGEVRVLAAAWRFPAAQGGARVALELRRALGEGRLACGLEEQHGVRKAGATAAALRQGAWLEWSGGVPPLGLALRHESWGSEPWVRDVVRTVTSVRIDARAPLGVEITLSHSLFRTRRGESLYLAEAESDRLVLRALSGEGQRTRLEARVPAGRRGRVRATLLLTTRGPSARPPQWTLEWIRRSRPERAPSPAPPSSP